MIETENSVELDCKYMKKEKKMMILLFIASEMSSRHFYFVYQRNSILCHPTIDNVNDEIVFTNIDTKMKKKKKEEEEKSETDKQTNMVQDILFECVVVYMGGDIILQHYLILKVSEDGDIPFIFQLRS
ncbi:hypothetical protein BLOT_001980 [Blomia tropicalis]|nr:hypothetical protein BLOT_001980 [Blomia tropicalis]